MRSVRRPDVDVPHGGNKLFLQRRVSAAIGALHPRDSSSPCRPRGEWLWPVQSDAGPTLRGVRCRTASEADRGAAQSKSLVEAMSARELAALAE
jgi:hypothetical protein